jgi:hypothetical protein
VAILVSDAQASLQAKGYGTDTSAAQIVALNAAHRRILTQRRWPFMERTTTVALAAAATSAALPAGVQRVEGIRLSPVATGQFVPLPTFIDITELRDRRIDDPVADIPEKWSVSNSVLEFYPAADQAYTVTVDYITEPGNLTAGANPLLVPDAYLDLVVWGAVVDMAFRQRDNGAMSMAKQQFDERMREMIAQYGVRQSQTASTVLHWDGWQNVER